MKENEQKSLGQIAHEAYLTRGEQLMVPWDKYPDVRQGFEKAASSVEMAVLRSLKDRDNMQCYKCLALMYLCGNEWICSGCGHVIERIKEDHRVNLDALTEGLPKSEFLTPEELRAMLGGREPHRSDMWSRKMLPHGTRPLIYGEWAQKGDEYYVGGDEWETYDNMGTYPVEGKSDNWLHHRTTRLLPLPPTTEQNPEGEAQRAFVPTSSESPTVGTNVPPVLERCCEVMHDACEAAAIRHGWKTQEASRRPWKDVPESNKCTMRCAVNTLIRHLVENPLIDWKGFHDSLKRQADDKIATLTKERDEALVWKEVAQSWESGLKTWRERAEHAEKLSEEMRSNAQLANERRYQAEKNLAEVEKLEQNERAARVAIEEHAKSLEEQLKEKQRGWIPVSDRMPDEKIDRNDILWLKQDQGFSVWHAGSKGNHHYISGAATHWMKCPLPTPTEEKDPERQAAVAYDSYRSKTPDGHGMSFADFKIAFLAGAASNSPLTKD
jgi:hypothetical protein